MIERTLVLIKPDAMRRGLRDEILRRFRGIPGLKIVKIDEFTVTREEAEEHYAEHRGKLFFEDLVAFSTSGPMVKMIIEGEGAISVIRRAIGPTNLHAAIEAPGTIRGDLAHFGAEPWETLVHASDSVESADREMKLHFDASYRNAT